MSIATAIRNRQLLSFTYSGALRTVEPHTYGIDLKGYECLRGYQTSGGSKSGQPTGWKVFHVSDMQNLTVLTNKFAGPQPDYKRGDHAFRVIHAEL